MCGQQLPWYFTPSCSFCYCFKWETPSGRNVTLCVLLVGIKESVCWTPPPEVNPNKTCEYQALCARFKDLLTLPGQFHPKAFQSVSDINSCNKYNVCLLNKDGYFNEDAKYNLCYCESCHKLRGDEAYYKRGEPPRDYALPFGWCRFALRWEYRVSVTYMTGGKFIKWPFWSHHYWM